MQELKSMGGSVNIDLHRVSSPSDRGTIETLTAKVDRLMRDHAQEFSRLIEQYDQIINRPNLDPELKMRALESKAKILNNLSDNSTRIALSIERERRMIEEKARTAAINKQSAVRLIEHGRKVQKSLNPGIDPSLATKPPKVRMYDPGAKFVATVGLDRFDPEEDLPEPS
jgi:hypothetical protein